MALFALGDEYRLSPILKSKFEREINWCDRISKKGCLRYSIQN